MYGCERRMWIPNGIVTYRIAAAEKGLWQTEHDACREDGRRKRIKRAWERNKNNRTVPAGKFIRETSSGRFSRSTVTEIAVERAALTRRKSH